MSPVDGGQLEPLLDSHDDHDGDEGFDLEKRQELEAALVKKVDKRMSILVLIYILNCGLCYLFPRALTEYFEIDIDRNNAAAARLRGFQKDLDLTDAQFATVLSVLYIGYTIMQIPSNMFLNHVGKPSIYLPVCMIIWGAISVATGTTFSF
ncbi:hypothetical protein EST38_g562 [Candolleomyces aberdarensis]|uniref:Major facilitator superfamily (MFS) profile domain-containing protein n=1 Tax=Candolleomyces aberdarensis TaxID=2316362 RepID=A0A4Q2DYB0_9AGAR|nr:hypothetical protein EST38_g562 [Candolleomyces aberdarensis]